MSTLLSNNDGDSLLYDNFSAYHTKLPVLAPSAAACSVIALSSCPNLPYQNSNNLCTGPNVYTP